MTGPPDTPRRVADIVSRQAQDAQRIRADAARARQLAAAMAADNTERRVRMGQLLWRICQRALHRETGPDGPAARP